MLRLWPFMTCLILLSSCDMNHRHQVSFRSYERDQLPPEGTSPLKEIEPLAPISLQDLKEGAQIFRKQCVACHGPEGRGDGVITRKGYKVPESLYSKEVLEKDIEAYVDLLTNGIGRMPSFRRRLVLSDRYKVAHYIKALQLSKKFPVSELDRSDREKLP